MPKRERLKSSLPPIAPRDLERFGSSAAEDWFIIRREDGDDGEPRRRPLTDYLPD